MPARGVARFDAPVFCFAGGGGKVTRDEALKTAEQWQDTMLELNAQMDSLTTLVGVTPESPLPAAIYKMQGDYTSVVSDLLGISDEWLMTWWIEYNHGERPMKAGLKGKPLLEIKTLADLLALVRDDEGVAK